MIKIQTIYDKTVQLINKRIAYALEASYLQLYYKREPSHPDSTPIPDKSIFA
jgi:hypothetical protein